MRVAGMYSFNGGKEEVTRRYPHLLTEVNAVIKGIDASRHKTKESKESRRNYEMLYDPKSLNRAFKTGFADYQWKPVRVPCEYPTGFYEDDLCTGQKL